jgi:hypothetical protein
MRAYEPTETFISGTEVSATTLTTIANNTMVLDAASRRMYPTHYVHQKTGNTAQGVYGGIVEGNLLWRGGFQYRTGMTTATFKIYCDPELNNLTSSNKLVIQFNNAANNVSTSFVTVVNTDATALSGIETFNITINNKGYSDYDIVTVKIYISVVNVYPDEEIIGSFYVQDAYVTPMNTISIGTNPTLDSFGQLTETRLNNLVNKGNWLMNRMAIVPMPLHHSLVYHQVVAFGPWEQWFYYAKVNFGSNGTHVRIYCWWWNWVPDYITITMNSQTLQYGPFSGGEVWPGSPGYIDIPRASFSASLNTDYVIRFAQKVTGTYGPALYRNDRVVIPSIEIINSSEPTVTDLEHSTILESIQFDDLQDRLNTFVTQLNTTESLISSRSTIWNRAQMFRARMVFEEGQIEYWDEEMPHHHRRQGDILWVKGRNVSINYGPVSMKPLKWDEEDIERDFLYSEKITGADYEVVKVELDKFPALTPGTGYFLFGDVIYAAEHLRDVE